jgi:S-adenosylmethionine:tRNA ribosyltransferase-isomerase
MRVSDFYYYLPKNLIAQKPLKERDKSKLLIINRKEKSIKEDIFYNIPKYLDSNDCLVLNDSKVIPGRLFAIKEKTGAKIEILLLNEVDKNLWISLIKPYKRVKNGTVLNLLSRDNSEKVNIKSIIEDKMGNGIAKIRFKKYPDYKKDLKRDIFSLGLAPIPPYIKNPNIPINRYQTIYARKEGSAAAPTAGLHFTDNVFKKIIKKDIKLAYVTLHVGLDTFRTIKVNNIENHVMHSEQFYISKEQSGIINKVKIDGGRIIAVGTTTVRALESASENGKVKALSGKTDLFITPNYKFKIIDGIITNFHLPCSTLYIMICAFVGRDFLMKVYNFAISKKYRFYTFGDAILIL